jgi:hypothetical protein
MPTMNADAPGPMKFIQKSPDGAGLKEVLPQVTSAQPLIRRPELAPIGSPIGRPMTFSFESRGGRMR